MQTKKLAAPTTSSSSRVPSQQSAPLIDPPPCCSRCTPGASWPRKYRSPQGRTSTAHSNHVRKLRRRIRRWMSRRGPAPEVQAQTRWTTLKPGVRKRTPSLETVIPRGDNVPAERAPSSGIAPSARDEIQPPYPPCTPPFSSQIWRCQHPRDSRAGSYFLPDH